MHLNKKVNVTNEYFKLQDEFFANLKDKLVVNKKFSRQMVSYQGNKNKPKFRWFRYKEGFSADLIEEILKEYGSPKGKVLDPFAGMGTTLIKAKSLGWDSIGIEILPIGKYVVNAMLSAERVDAERFKKAIIETLENYPYCKESKQIFKHISITEGAFSKENEELLNKYMAYVNQHPNFDKDVKSLLEFACFCILEDISYTEKAGQYLKWDGRSPLEKRKSNFRKDKILAFDEAIRQKLHEMLQDIYKQKTLLEYFLDGENSNEKLSEVKKNEIIIFEGSSLELLPTIESNSIDFVLTSPPYLNRYDYTRTYALELVFLQYNGEQIKKFRQNLISCTVENKSKREFLKKVYAENDDIFTYEKIIEYYDNNRFLNLLNTTMDFLLENGKLNNSGIPRMVENYFLEMAFIIHEIKRCLKPNRYFIMVNDNVRYAGMEIPVDLILSQIAVDFGFEVEKIWVLPKGKGNSSQQMQEYGRIELRKCIYVWKNKAK